MRRKSYRTYNLCIALLCQSRQRALRCSSDRGKRQRDQKRKTFLLNFLFFLKSGPVQTGRPPPGRGGGWESESLRVFNTRQESGNGTPKLRTGSRSVLQYGTGIRDWVPV